MTPSIGMSVRRWTFPREQAVVVVGTLDGRVDPVVASKGVRRYEDRDRDDHEPDRDRESNGNAD